MISHYTLAAIGVNATWDAGDTSFWVCSPNVCHVAKLLVRLRFTENHGKRNSLRAPSLHDTT